MTLDEEVARALGWVSSDIFRGKYWVDSNEGYHLKAIFKPSTNWAQGGLIISNNDISIIKVKSSFSDEQWAAYMQGRMQQKEYGSTPLIAACKAIVVMEGK